MQWFLNIAKNDDSEYQKNILTAILPQIIPFFNPTANKFQHINCNHNISSYFVLRTIMKINLVPICFQEKELDEKEPLAIKAKNDNQGLLKDYELAKKAVQDLTVYYIIYIC